MESKPIESRILQLTATSFEAEVIDNPTPILIDFWAPWCGPCRAMKPILVEAAELLKERVRVAQINIDEEGELAAAFGIRSIPTCVLIQDGRIVDSFVGVIPARTLAANALSKLGDIGLKKAV